MPRTHLERNAREHNYERAADPADTADRPLEPRSSHEPLHDADVPHPRESDENPQPPASTPTSARSTPRPIPTPTGPRVPRTTTIALRVPAARARTTTHDRPYLEPADEPMIAEV